MGLLLFLTGAGGSRAGLIFSFPMLPLSLRPRLRASAFYLVITLLLGLATVRALLIAGPLFSTSLAAERYVGDCHEQQRSLLLRGEFDDNLKQEQELRRAEERSNQAEQARLAAVDTSLDSLMPLFALVAVLALLVDAYVKESFLTTIFFYGGAEFFVGTVVARNWQTIADGAGRAGHLVRELLTTSRYEGILVILVVLVLGLALAYDLRRRQSLPVAAQE